MGDGRPLPGRAAPDGLDGSAERHKEDTWESAKNRHRHEGWCAARRDRARKCAVRYGNGRIKEADRDRGKGAALAAEQLARPRKKRDGAGRALEGAKGSMPFWGEGGALALF